MSGGTLGIRDWRSEKPLRRSLTRVRSRAAFLAVSPDLQASPPAAAAAADGEGHESVSHVDAGRSLHQIRVKQEKPTSVSAAAHLAVLITRLCPTRDSNVTEMHKETKLLPQLVVRWLTLSLAESESEFQDQLALRSLASHHLLFGGEPPRPQALHCTALHPRKQYITGRRCVLSQQKYIWNTQVDGETRDSEAALHAFQALDDPVSSIRSPSSLSTSSRARGSSFPRLPFPSVA